MLTRRAVVSAAGKLLRAGLDAFLDNLDARREVAAKAGAAHAPKVAARCLGAWRAVAARNAEHRHMALAVVTARRTRAVLGGSFDAWRERTARARQLDELMHHATSLRLKRTLLRCTAAWALYAATKQRRKAILAEALPKLRTAMLAASLRAWRDVVADTASDMAALRALALRRARHVVAVWRCRCATSRRVRAFSRRRTHGHLRDVLTAWFAWAHTRRRRHDVCDAAVARRSRNVLQAAFALWAAAAQVTRARTSAVDALVTYTASRRTVAAFRAWRSVSEAHFATRVAVFTAWRCCTAVSRAAEARLADTQAQHETALRDVVAGCEKSASEAHELLVSTLTSVAKQQVALQSAAAAAAAREAAVERFASWRERAHRRAVFAAWQAAAARSEHTRAVVAARASRARRAALAAAFAHWQHWVVRQRRKMHLLARAQRACAATQARFLRSSFLGWWRVAHARRAPQAALAAASGALAARSRRATLRWALTRWLAGALEQQRQVGKEARAMAHWRTRLLRACIFSWALHVSSQQAVLRRVAAMAARDAGACQRDALAAWKDHVTRAKAARSAQHIDMLQAELARLQSRYGRLVGAALEDPAAVMLRSGAATPAADGVLAYVRTPALSLVHSRVGSVAAVMT